jgi:hypothetical protein
MFRRRVMKSGPQPVKRKRSWLRRSRGSVAVAGLRV